MRRVRIGLFMFLGCVGMAGAGPALVDIRVFPETVSLSTRRDVQRMVVQAVYADTVTRDVTGEAQWVFSNEGTVRRDGAFLKPVADGETRLTVSFGGKQQEIPVRVARATEDRPAGFRLDVMPVFMRAGCNGGGCHGAARGQDGFRLSLFGFDPEGDHHRITKEIPGRRINTSLPGQSLLITKSVGEVPHTGGELFTRDSAYAKTLIEWLSRGAPNDPADVPEPTGLRIMPDRIVLAGEGTQHALTVVATYSDGTTRDVTPLAVFMSNNDNSGAVSEDGVVTAKSRGEAFVMARFHTFTEGAQVIVVPGGDSQPFPALAEANYIDTLVHNKLRKLRVHPAERSSDENFLRRVYVDLIGQLPNSEEYKAFMADAAPDKRNRLIDRLLERKEFVEMWVMQWAELLQIRSDQDFSYKSANLYYNWLQEKIASGVPVNKIVYDILRANGGTFENPPTNFYQIETDSLKVSENVAQSFMGIRTQCAQCHNHPFDRWTMNDYYGFVSFFTQVGRKRAEDPRETVIYNQNRGESNHPLTKKPVPPLFLGGEQPELEPNADRREALAAWLTSKENPYFARNLSNRIWAHFFGLGIVEPVDDVRISNPASNPELLDALADKLVAYDYDFKRLVRDICQSETYQRSTATNESNAGDTRNFARALPRRIRAEVLLDCISQVTATSDKFKGLPKGARAVQISDGATSTYFLTTFGRAQRESVCACEVNMEPNLSQALHLLNGDATARKISRGRVPSSLFKQGKDIAATVRELYIRSFSRAPTEKELQGVVAYVQAAENPETGLEDAFWALLNAKEFMFNH